MQTLVTTTMPRPNAQAEATADGATRIPRQAVRVWRVPKHDRWMDGTRITAWCRCVTYLPRALVVDLLQRDLWLIWFLVQDRGQIILIAVNISPGHG